MNPQVEIARKGRARANVRLAAALTLAGLLGAAGAARAGLTQPILPGQALLMASDFQTSRGTDAARKTNPNGAPPHSIGPFTGPSGFATGDADDAFTCAAQDSDLAARGASAYQTLVNGDMAAKSNFTRNDATTAVNSVGADEFLTNCRFGAEPVTDWGDAMPKNVYRSTGLRFDADGAGGTTAVVAVPLPPAFYTGVGVLTACAVIGLGRRFMGG